MGWEERSKRVVKLLAAGDQHDSRRGTIMEFLRLQGCMRGPETGELGAQQRPGFRFLSAGSDEALESVGARPDSQLKARPKYWMDRTGIIGGQCLPEADPPV